MICPGYNILQNQMFYIKVANPVDKAFWNLQKNADC